MLRLRLGLRGIDADLDGRGREHGVDRITDDRQASQKRVLARGSVGKGLGLGTAERAEIRVQWPDGESSASYRVFANQFVVIDRTKPQAAYWYPGR